MSLSFASLLFAAAQPAQAMEPPIAEVVASQQAVAPAAPLAGRWTHEVKDGELHVKLLLTNTGDEPVDVMVARGKLPGADVQADIGGMALERMYTDEEMSGRMSRMGPMPRFAPIAGNKEILAGTYRFQLPEGYRGETVHLEASVRADNTSVTLRTDLNAPLGV